MSVIKKNWDNKIATSKVDGLLSAFDDGELFVEEVFSENILFDDNKIKNASYDQDRGFGVRAVNGDSIRFFHSSDIDEDSLNKGINSIKKKIVLGGETLNSLKTNQSLYESTNPIGLVKLKEKIDFLKKINNYARQQSTSVKEVSISLNASYQNIEITKKNGDFFFDSRPLVRLNINISVSKNGKTETGSFGMGGRYMYERFFEKTNWQNAVDTAFSQASLKIKAEPTPAGEQTVVLGPGWPGILLHEAIGHGLEGDFNRKKNLSFL